MKILHIVENYSLASGGIRTVVENLNKELQNLNYNSIIITSLKEKDDDVFVVNCQKKIWLYSKKWYSKILEIHNEKKIDCIHIHGVWMYPQYIAAKFSVKHNIPFIVSPHGMYEPWLWTKGILKKKIIFNFLIKKHFSKASTIHAITNQEKENLKKLFLKTNVFEIPNLITEAKNSLAKLSLNDKYIFYIGRLDQKKGIDLLIRAFLKINPKNFKLKIAGEINSYKKDLEEIINANNIDANKIEFLGFVSGCAKDKLINNAFVVVAPSHSEVIGMVNLESAILKTPVITTYQTGLNPLWNENGGILINPNETELVKALEEVFMWSNKDQIENGERLHNFVSENYTWKNKRKDWQKLYKSVCNG